MGHGSGETPFGGPEILYNSYGDMFENVFATMDWRYGAETYTRTAGGVSIGSSNGGNYQIHNPAGIITAARLDGNKCSNARILGSLAYLKADNIFHFAGTNLVTMVNMNGWGADCVTLNHVMGYIDPGHDRYGATPAISLGPPDSSFGTTGAGNSGSNLTSVSGINMVVASNWTGGNRVSGRTLAGVPSPWTSTTSANLCKRWINGVQTNEPLWPWPMNARILAATAMAGRYEGPCLGCSGGRAIRTPIDVTADIESILGPIPSECRSSVGSSPPPTTPPGVPPPPTTFGAGPRGIDIVGKSEFVRLESSARAIFVFDSDRAGERVAFPITVEQKPYDASEAANAGYALTWLVDLRQTVGTGLSEPDLLYAGLDVEAATPYQARIIGNPVVNRELMDTFWGVTEVSGMSVTLSNADGLLTQLYTAADLRGQTIILRRYDFRTGETIDELNAKISAVGIGPGTITISASSPDLSLFEREIPTTVVTTAQFPKALDVGATIPVVFGQVAKVPLLYVNDDTELNQYDYLLGHDTVNALNVYFVRSDGGVTQIPFQDWAVRTDIYPGLSVLRFTSRQVDASGRPRRIVADVDGGTRNFARCIERILAGPNAWGLNGSAGGVDTASFDNAATSLDQVGLLCDGVIREARQVQDILRELMIVRGMRLNFTTQGLWALTLDAPKFVAKISIGDGRADGPRNILSAGQRQRVDTEDAVSTYSIRYRLDFLGGFYRNNFDRTVHPTFGRERVLEANFVRDHTAANIIIEYLSRREAFNSQTSSFTIAQEGRKLLEGDLVEVTYLPFDFIRNILEVRKVTKRLETVEVVLNGGGTAGDIPGDSLDGVAIGGGGSGPNNGGTGGGGQPGGDGTGTGPDTGGGGGGSDGGIGGGGGDGGFNDIFIPPQPDDDFPTDPDIPPPGTDPNTNPFILYAPGGYQLIGRFLDDNFVGCDVLLDWHRIAEVVPGVSDEDNLVNHELRDYQIEVWGEDETLRRTEYTFVPTYSYSIEKNRIDFPPNGSRIAKFILRGRTHSGTLGRPNSIWVEKPVVDLAVAVLPTTQPLSPA
jgi:hypothetical protein